MASLELDPQATLHELYRARRACGHALQWLAHPDCSLPAEARQDAVDDLIDAVRVHDLAIERLYAESNGRSYVGRRREGSRRARRGARRA